MIAVNDADFDWKEACISREEQHRLWSRYEETMDTFQFKEGLFSPVDALHFMKVSTD